MDFKQNRTLIIAIVINKSPLGIFAGLGAMAAVLLLIFKDSILGFVASIQLSANKMLKPGDWIEMPGHRADGTVIDISLNTVKVHVITSYSIHYTKLYDLRAEVHRDGKVWEQEFSIGKPLYAARVIGEADDTGTIVTFKPDGSIFLTTVYKYEILAARLRELAFLNAGVRLILTDLREQNENGEYKSEVFYSEAGLKEFVEYLDTAREKLIEETIHISSEKGEVPVEIALHYNTSFNENIHSYVNNINTIEGGTHLTGFRRGLTRTLKNYAETSGMLAKLKFDIV